MTHQHMKTSVYMYKECALTGMIKQRGNILINASFAHVLHRTLTAYIVCTCFMEEYRGPVQRQWSPYSWNGGSGCTRFTVAL